MPENTKYVRIGAYFGIAAVTVYILSTIISMYLYPGPFSPLDSTISHLGNATANPGGNLIFDAGNVLAGLLFLPFVASLAAPGTGRKLKGYLAAAAVFPGVVMSIGLALIGVYPETLPEIHVPIAVITFLSLTIMLLLVNLVMWGDSRYPGWLALFGGAALLINCAQIGLVLTGSFPAIVEWLSAYLPQVWILLLCYHTLTEARQHVA